MASDELDLGPVWGDPFIGYYWPSEERPVSESLEAAHALARRLSWLLWELDIEAEIEVQRGSPAMVLSTELGRQGHHSVIVAASTTQQWRNVVRRAAQLTSTAGAEIRVAVDSPPSRMQRWLLR